MLFCYINIIQYRIFFTAKKLHILLSKHLSFGCTTKMWNIFMMQSVMMSSLYSQYVRSLFTYVTSVLQVNTSKQIIATLNCNSYWHLAFIDIWIALINSLYTYIHMEVFLWNHGKLHFRFIIAIPIPGHCTHE